jgi:hypothetical protein
MKEIIDQIFNFIESQPKEISDELKRVLYLKLSMDKSSFFNYQKETSNDIVQVDQRGFYG